jgi:hypothetical protein
VVLLTFCLDWSWMTFFSIATSQVAGIKTWATVPGLLVL